MCDQFGYILSARRIVRACAAIVNSTLVLVVQRFAYNFSCIVHSLTKRYSVFATRILYTSIDI